MKKKVYHGPINIGGIGGYISQYLRSKGYISDFIVWSDFTMRNNHDYNLHIERYNFFKKIFIIIKNFFKVLIKYNILHFYAGKTLLPFGLDYIFKII